MNEKKASILYARIDDACRNLYKPIFFGFFNLSEQAGIDNLLRRKKTSYVFCGGFAECERKMLCLFPDNVYSEDLSWPIGALRFYRDFPMDHRNVLGALMSLGITRESLGDISLSSTEVQVIFKAHLASFLENEFVSIRGKTIKPVFVHYHDIRAFALTFKDMSITVSSMRIDSIIARIWALSRQNAATAIRQGRIRLNDTEVCKLTTKVKLGDVISMRGKGKAVIETFDGSTKNSRIRLSIKRYS